MSPLEWKMIVKEFSMNGKNYETIRFLKKLGFTPDDDKDVEESRNLTTGHGVGKVVEYWTDQREDSSHAKVIFVPGEKYLKTMRKVCSRKPQIWGYGCLQTEEHAIRCVSLE